MGEKDIQQNLTLSWRPDQSSENTFSPSEINSQILPKTNTLPFLPHLIPTPVDKLILMFFKSSMIIFLGNNPCPEAQPLLLLILKK